MEQAGWGADLSVRSWRAVGGGSDLARGTDEPRQQPCWSKGQGRACGSRQGLTVTPTAAVAAATTNAVTAATAPDSTSATAGADSGSSATAGIDSSASTRGTSTSTRSSAGHGHIGAVGDRRRMGGLPTSSRLRSAIRAARGSWSGGRVALIGRGGR